MFADEAVYCAPATATTLGDAIVGLPVSPRQRRSNQIPMRVHDPGGLDRSGRDHGNARDRRALLRVDDLAEPIAGGHGRAHRPA